MQFVEVGDNLLSTQFHILHHKTEEAVDQSVKGCMAYLNN